MKIIVTGASGFVGNHVVNELLKRGIDTCAVARRPVKFTNSLIVDSYFDTPVGDILIHLAENPNRAQVNRLGNDYAIEKKAIVESLILKGFKRIVFVSSVSVYGDKSQKSWKPVDRVLSGDIYSQSKLNCELLVQRHNGVIARMSNLYGFGMSPDNVLSKIISQMPCGNEITIWNGRPVRDFLWIDDAVNALVEMALGQEKGIYNVASGKAISIYELTEMVLKQSGNEKSCNINVTKPIKEESSIRLDILDTFNAFDWEPEMKLKDGINLLLNHKK